MRKLVTDYGALDIYKYYCKKTGNPRNLTQAEYSAITKKFFAKIFDELIFKGREFTMPNRLGNLRVRKYKNKPKLDRNGKLDKRSLAPNWKVTKQLWAEQYPGKTLQELKEVKHKQVIFYMNKHTDGYAHKWYWDKTTCITKNHAGYIIEVNRTSDRRLAKALQDEDLHLDYSLF